MRKSDSNKKEVRSTLKDLGVRPSKKRGQNFAVDPVVIDSILELAGPISGAMLEIGPGLGALTERLVPNGPLTVIEIEPTFAALIKSTYPAVEVIQDDVRNVDLSKLGSELTVFGNLPYVFSTEIVFHLIRHRSVIKRAILLLQREFVERLKAPPGGRDYGSLSVAVQLWATVRGGAVIPGSAFQPSTAVESQVVELCFRDAPAIPVDDEQLFERVVRSSFSQRRKTLANSLSSSGRWSKEVVLAACAKIGVDPVRRAETLSLAEFAQLARALSS